MSESKTSRAHYQNGGKTHEFTVPLTLSGKEKTWRPPLHTVHDGNVVVLAGVQETRVFYRLLRADETLESWLERNETT